MGGKQVEVELDTIPDWVTSIRSLIRKRIFNLFNSMSFKVRSIFNNKGVVEHLSDLHNTYIVVPVDKAYQ